MDANIIKQLKELGFKKDPEKLDQPIMECRAYHNTFNNVTDSSYAVLYIGDVINENGEEAKNYINNIVSVFTKLYSKVNDCFCFSPFGGLPFMWTDSRLHERSGFQIEFGGCLKQDELVNKIHTIISMFVEGLPQEVIEKYNLEKQDMIRKSINYLIIIDLLITNGSVSYDYTEQRYDPLN